MEEKEKLDLILEKISEIEKKVEDTNDIVHGQRNSERWGKLFWFIKWGLIIASGVVAWAYIQPMYESAINNYNKAVETANKAGATLDKIPDAEDIKNLGNLDALKEKLNELKK